MSGLLACRLLSRWPRPYCAGRPIGKLRLPPIDGWCCTNVWARLLKLPSTQRPLRSRANSRRSRNRARGARPRVAAGRPPAARGVAGRPAAGAGNSLAAVGQRAPPGPLALDQGVALTDAAAPTDSVERSALEDPSGLAAADTQPIAQTQPDANLASRVQQEQAESDALNKLSQALDRVSAAQPAADSIRQGDLSQARDQLTNLGNEADQLSAAAKQQLSGALQQASTQTTATDRQLADRERQAAQALGRPNYNDQRQALNALADQVERSGSRAAPADQLAREAGLLQQQQAASKSQGQGQGQPAAARARATAPRAHRPRATALRCGPAIGRRRSTGRRVPPASRAGRASATESIRTCWAIRHASTPPDRASKCPHSWAAVQVSAHRPAPRIRRAPIQPAARAASTSLSRLNKPGRSHRNRTWCRANSGPSSEATSDQQIESADTIGLTAEIVSAYLSHNTVASGDIPALINQVHSALLRLSTGEAATSGEPLKPAVPVKKSINPDFIVCLEDGKKFKSLKRHLRTQYEMTPEQYREKWGAAARLSDGRAELCRRALASRQADGARPAAPPAALGLGRPLATCSP